MIIIIQLNEQMEYTASTEIESWFDQLNCLMSQAKCEAPRFIKPYHLATLAHKARTRQVDWLKLPDKLTGYANTMKLWHALGIEPPAEISSRRPSGRYYPLEMMRDSNTIDQCAMQLTDLFKPICSDYKTIDAIDTMLRELIGNCYAHSDVKDGVYGAICAQVWSGGSKAQIAIADTGIGIRNSLMQNGLLADRLSVTNSCELATEYGITSKPGKGHSGYGLAVARKLLEQNNGVLFVRSGYEGFFLHQNKIQTSHTKSHWDGTLLVIEWDITKPMNISEVYSNFPKPEGMDDDDFDFL